MTEAETHRILVVEDEYLLASDISAALRQAGSTIVGPFASVADALEVLARQPEIDGAVLDINIRGEKVFPVADELRRRGVPFVFTTGYDSAALAEAYSEAPRWEKPFDAADLVGDLAFLRGRDVTDDARHAAQIRMRS